MLVPEPDARRLPLLAQSLVSIADAPCELPGRVHDDLRVIALDVMAAIGNANVVRSREVGSDLILHVRQ